MNIPCIFGHKWVGCKCSACGKTRDQGHDWSEDCERCARCAASRAAAHQWEGSACSCCSRPRNESHHWERVYDGGTVVQIPRPQSMFPQKCRDCGGSGHGLGGGMTSCARCHGTGHVLD